MTFYKCLKYCGCGYNGQCIYCNEPSFIGFTPTNSDVFVLFNQTNLVASNTDGNTCVQNKQEDIDVSLKIIWLYLG